MYAWIFRHLPGPAWLKTIEAVLLIDRQLGNGMEGGVEAAAFAESFGSTENPHTCNYATHQSQLSVPAHILPPTQRGCRRRDLQCPQRAY